MATQRFFRVRRVQMTNLHSNLRRAARPALLLILLVACMLAASPGQGTAKPRPAVSHVQISRGKCVRQKRASKSSARARRGRLPRKCPRPHEAPGAIAVPPPAAGSGSAPGPPPAVSGGNPPTSEGNVGSEKTPVPEEPMADPEEPSSGRSGPIDAQAEDFAGQPSDVLLTYEAAASPSEASQCVGLASGQAVGFGGVDQGPAPKTIRLELVPGGAMPDEVQCPSESGDGVLTVSAAAPSTGGVVDDPIAPKYLTEVPFGRRSFWIQPWRAYLDTWPASRLTEAVGINFNVNAPEAASTAQLLQSSGFKLARIEISWGQVSYADPSHFVNEGSLRQRLVALREHGLRPLILLNSNSGGPAPAQAVTLTTTAPAAAGSRTVMLDQASAAAVVPEKTGFANLSFGGNPDILVTSVSGSGKATLSQPLATELPVGPHIGATLRFGPFGPPKLANGATNPEYQRTLNGWLEYVGTVNHLAAEVFGAGNYDFEVWNELSFGSQFLGESPYYSPVRVSGFGSITAALMEATVEYLRDPAHGVSPEVGITDGFASQTPFVGGGSVPVGTTALSKHLYASPLYFPRNATINGVKPLDALGRSDATGRNAPFTPKFTPNFGSAFPEYYLTAIQTESLIRDLSPDTNTIYGVPHGRDVEPPGGSPAEIWMTEYNLNTNTLLPLPTGNQDQYIGGTTEAQRELLQAEIVLRSLVSMVNKGLGREYFYAAAHNPGYELISKSFMNAVDADPATYPAGQSGGDTMTALPRMLSHFAGPGPSGQLRQLSLLSIAQEGDQAVWSGDGTAAHPNLYTRELLAVLPFQSAPTHFVIPFYVMTPNLTTVWNPAAPADSPTRFDLPDEHFRITVGNLPETTAAPEVSAYDPLRDESTPARLVSQAGDRAVFEISATDYPRLLSIEYDE